MSNRMAEHNQKFTRKQLGKRQEFRQSRRLYSLLESIKTSRKPSFVSDCVSEILENGEARDFIKYTFIKCGGQIISVLGTYLEQVSNPADLLRLLIYFTGSYHFNNYSLDQALVLSLLVKARNYSDEQVARLALTCLADIFARSPELTLSGFPTLYRLLLDLTNETNLPTTTRLHYSLLRNLYLSTKCLTPRSHQLISFVASVVRLLNHTGCNAEDQVYETKAKDFGLQTLQAVFKSHGNFLFPFVGLLFPGTEHTCWIDLVKNPGLAPTALKTLAVVLDSLPFANLFVSESPCLWDLSKKTVKIAHEALATAGNTQDEGIAACALAKALLRCPKILSDPRDLTLMLEKVKPVNTGDQRLHSEQILVQVAACEAHSDLISLETVSQMELAQDDPCLAEKLVLYREVLKDTVVSEEVFTKLRSFITHSNYKVVNQVFLCLEVVSVRHPEILMQVIQALEDALTYNSMSVIPPALNLLANQEVLPSHPRLSAIVQALEALLNNKGVSTYMQGSIIKFLGRCMCHNLLSKPKEFLDLLIKKLQQHKMVVAFSISVSSVLMSSSSHAQYYLQEMKELLNSLMKLSKACIKMNLALSISFLLQNCADLDLETLDTFSNMVFDLVLSKKAKIGELSLNCIVSISHELQRRHLPSFSAERLANAFIKARIFKVKLKLLQLLEQHSSDSSKIFTSITEVINNTTSKLSQEPADLVGRDEFLTVLRGSALKLMAYQPSIAKEAAEIGILGDLFEDVPDQLSNIAAHASKIVLNAFTKTEEIKLSFHAYELLSSLREHSDSETGSGEDY